MRVRFDQGLPPVSAFVPRQPFSFVDWRAWNGHAVAQQKTGVALLITTLPLVLRRDADTNQLAAWLHLFAAEFDL